MPWRNASELVDFDADAALEVALATVDGPLYSFVEFDVESFHPLYVADETLAMYEDEQQMLAHFEEMHDYVNLDFTEIKLFTENLLPVADEVRYKTTAMDVMKIARIYRGHHGLFISLAPEEPVEPLVTAIADAIDGESVSESRQ